MNKNKIWSWSQFDRDAIKYIKKRDGAHCIICGCPCDSVHLAFSAHAQARQDTGCLICPSCESLPNTELLAQKYLISFYNIKDLASFKKELIFHKDASPQATVQPQPTNFCLGCAFFRRDHRVETPTYWCAKYYKNVTRDLPACDAKEEYKK